MCGGKLLPQVVEISEWSSGFTAAWSGGAGGSRYEGFGTTGWGQPGG
jgi:hypothetical protein